MALGFQAHELVPAVKLAFGSALEIEDGAACVKKAPFLSN